MAVRMTKAWVPLTPENVARLPAHLGVFELGDTDGQVIYIGCANGRTRFGLREALGDILASADREAIPGATSFRVESTMAYHSRVRELLQTYLHDHGSLPMTNTGLTEANLGRINPG